MPENKQPKKPLEVELAPSNYDRDVGYTFANKLVSPSDQVLMGRAYGNYDVYQELLRDDQVFSTFQQRRRAVVSKDWTVDPGDDSATAKEAAEALSENLLAIDWDMKTDLMLYGVFYGFAVGECMWEMKKGRVWLSNILVRDRNRFRFDNQRNLYLKTRSKPQGELQPDRKYWTFSTGADHDDEPYGRGLAHHLYWPVFFKRQDIRFWIQFLEKFASPTATAKASSGKTEDPIQRQKILGMLQAINRDAAVLVPDDVEVALLEATRSGTVDYDAMREAMDRAITRINLSQLLTTEAEGGQYKAEVQMEVRDQVIKADADLLTSSFTKTAARWLTDWNFGEGVPAPIVRRITEPEEDINDRAERDNKVYQLGYEPTPEYIEQHYGEGWVKRENPNPFQPDGAQNNLPPEFAEAVAEAMGGHIADQNRIKEAAQQLSLKFKEHLGGRIDELLGYLDDSGDLVTFRRKLVEMAEEEPNQQVIETLQNQSVISRLMGMLRQQRR